MTRGRVFALVVLACLVPPHAARAQWSASPLVDNPVCSAPHDQFFVASTGDGAGGVIIAWQDYREDSLGDIYAQRMSADGVPLWTPGGIPIVTGLAPALPRLVPDGEGGAILIYEETGTAPGPRIMARRIGANGQPRWVGATTLCSAYTAASPPVVIADGAGGAFVAWTDMRAEPSNGTDIEAQHVDRNGLILFPPDGLPACAARGHQNQPALALLADGSAFIAWQDARAGETGTGYDLYAQRVTPGGAILWVPNGVAVADSAGLDADPIVVADGAGGGFVVWMQPRGDGAGSDLMAARLDGTGAHAWSDGPRAVTDIATMKGAHRAVTDGAGGFIVAWEDHRSVTHLVDLLAQRVDPGGNTLWAPNGVVVSGAEGNQRLAAGIADGAGGAVFTWEDFRLVIQSDIYAARVAASGEILWIPDGLPVCTATESQEQPVIAAGEGGAHILAWADRRDGNRDVYAARIRPDGALGVSFLPDHFTFEDSVGVPLDTLVAGDTVAVRIVARTMSGFVADEFTGRAGVSSDGELGIGAGPSAPFVAGVLATSLSFLHSGRWHLFSTEEDGGATGASGPLLVRPPRPVAFTATGSPREERAVELAWSPSTTGDASGYNVYRSTEAIYDTTSHRVLLLPGSAVSVTDTVPDFGTWHYRIVARDDAGIVSESSTEEVAVAPPLFFDIETSIFQNRGATRHLDIVVGAESLIVGTPSVSLADSAAPAGSELALIPIPGGVIPGGGGVFTGAMDLVSEGTHRLRTRATASDGRRADRLRLFNAAIARSGEAARVATPGGEVVLELAPGALAGEAWILTEMATGGDESTPGAESLNRLHVRFSPSLELRREATIEWSAPHGSPGTGGAPVAGYRIERRDAIEPRDARAAGEGSTWTPLFTVRSADGAFLRATTTRLGEFRLAPAPADSAFPASPLELVASPNPCRGGATIRCSLPSEQRIDVSVFDLAGRRVAVLASGAVPAGPREFRWRATGLRGARLAPGLYFVRLRAAHEAVSVKLLLID